MAKYKFRFMVMMKKHSPMKRMDVSRRALPQFRIKMKELRSMLTKLENEGLIEQYPLKTEGVGGKTPDIFAITLAGRGWITEEKKKQRQALKGVK